MTLQVARSLHIIGIGGIGVSAIAKWALEHGKQVSGSDVRENESTQWLREHGAIVHVGEHAAAHLPAMCDLVLHTVAVQTANVERVAAVQRGIPLMSYPAAVNELLIDKNGIAIAGTHGKSTTTALLATILLEAHRDPTVIVGTKLRRFGNTNEYSGKGNDVLVEADEYNQGILLYHPRYAAVLNVDSEHVDVYPTLVESQRAFATFVSHVDPSGSVALNADDPSCTLLAQAAQAAVLTFGLKDADLVARNITPSANGLTFTVSGLYAGEIQSLLFGYHNVQNILAALCVAHSLSIPFAAVQAAVAAFPGTWRRFERRGEWQGATVIDDYAHHPTEIAATLQAARQAYPGQRLVSLFQPHLHSRTAAFFKDFASVLRGADVAVLLDVYDVAGREGSERVSSERLAKAVGETAVYAGTFEQAMSLLASKIRPGDVLLTLGAGDVTHFYERVHTKNPSVEARGC